MDLRKALSCAALCLPALVPCSGLTQVVDEYEVKAIFLVNFASFTEWPASSASELNLCVYGKDPFGASIDKHAGRKIGPRTLSVKRSQDPGALSQCQIVFISRQPPGNLHRAIESIRAGGVLTVADTEGAGRDGVMINMSLGSDKVSFEVNAEAAKRAGLSISSKLLRLATAVY
jgi:hypothetical protein